MCVDYITVKIPSKIIFIGFVFIMIVFVVVIFLMAVFAVIFFFVVLVFVIIIIVIIQEVSIPHCSKSREWYKRSENPLKHKNLKSLNFLDLLFSLHWPLG